MLLLTHVIIAIASILHATYLLAHPTKNGFKAAYGLIGATLGSGTILVVTMNAPLLKACLSGLFYLGIVLTALSLAHARLGHSDVTHYQD